MMLGRILQRLNLTDEQRQSIRKVLEGAKADMETSRKAVADAARALHEAATQGTDEAAIREAAATLGKAIGEQAVARVKIMASVKEVLTEEQLAELEKMRTQRGDMRDRIRAPEFRQGFGRFGQGRGLRGPGRYWQGGPGWGRGGGPRTGAAEQGLDRPRGRMQGWW